MTRIVSSILNRLAFSCPGGSSIRPRLQRWRGVDVGHNVWLGRSVYVDDLHPEALSIGDGCTIGIRSTILTHFYWGARRADGSARVVIERDVFIGPHCVILPNVTIGEGSVIKAGTVVSQNVPPRSFYGSPSPEVLGTVSTPLTARTGYSRFLAGMRPVRLPDQSS